MTTTTRTTSRLSVRTQPLLRTSSVLALSLSMALAPMVSLAGPEGGQVTAGQASISQSGPSTVIDQASQRAVIDWQSFNVDSHESVHFDQAHGASAATLNRVLAGQESIISGSITAPGQVVLYNSQGVMFTDGAQVDVGGLVATTIAPDVDSFMGDGVLAMDQRFNDRVNPDATVSNAGDIDVSEAGLAAFVGPHVENSGHINARLGTAALVSGEAVTLDMYGDDLVNIAITDPATAGSLANTGTIAADGGQVVISAAAASNVVDQAVNTGGVVRAQTVEQSEGRIVLAGANTSINITGQIDASGGAGQTGGSVIATGDSVTLSGSASIDASGGAGGGQVAIGGGYRGGPAPSGGVTVNRSGEQLAIALSRGMGAISQFEAAGDVHVAADAWIDASATQDGDGGNVFIWSDGTTTMDGAIQAFGAATGRGGFVETSGANLGVGATASVNTGGGVWLLDPEELIVGSGTDTATTEYVDAATIASNLDSNNVFLEAEALIRIEDAIINESSSNLLSFTATDTDGSIQVAAPVSTNGDILMFAGGGISIEQAGTYIDSGAGSVWLNAGQTGEITQDAGTAVLGTGVALIGGRVTLDSGLNYAGTLAGRVYTDDPQSTDTLFTFTQTNATGTTNIGTVTNDLGGTLTGVTILEEVLVAYRAVIGQSGTQEVVLTNGNCGQGVPWVVCNPDWTRSVPGNGQYNRLVFSALPYIPAEDAELLLNRGGGNGQGPAIRLVRDSDGRIVAYEYNTGQGQGGWQTISLDSLDGVHEPTGDSSDYFVGSIALTDGPQNNLTTYGPDTPNDDPNFDVIAGISPENGSIVINGNRWGIDFFDPQAQVPDQIRFQVFGDGTQNAPYRGDSERLIVDLDAPSTSGLWGQNNNQRAVIELTNLIANERGFYEVALIEGYRSELVDYDPDDPRFDISASQATATVNVGDQTRTYGDTSLTPVGDLYTIDLNPNNLIGGLNNQIGGTFSIVDAPSDGVDIDDPTLDVDTYVDAIGGTGLSSNRYAIEYENGDLEVTPAELTITADDQSKTYGELFTFNGTEFTTSGLQNNETVGSATLTSLGAPADADVGGYPIAISGATDGTFDPNNYDITYVPGTLTVTAASLSITIDDLAKFYGEDGSLTGTEFSLDDPDQLQNGETITSINLSSDAESATAAVSGSPYAITGDENSASGGGGFDPDNYDIQLTDGEYTVNAAPVALFAGELDETYGNVLGDPADYRDVNGLGGRTITLPEENFSYLAAFDTDGATDGIQLTVERDDASNWVLSGAGGNTLQVPVLTDDAGEPWSRYGVILPDWMVDADGAPILAGDTGQDWSTYLTSGAGNGQLGAGLTTSYVDQFSDAGTYDIEVAAQLSNNLTATNPDNVGPDSLTYDGLITIGLASLIITADNQTKTYGETFVFDESAPGDFSVVGLVGDDSVDGVDLSSAGAPATAPVAGSPYAITVENAAGNGLSNYEITYKPGTMTVNPAPLTITLDDQTKPAGQTFVFDGTEFGAEGLVNDEQISGLTITSPGAPPPADPGFYPIFGDDPQGITASNYDITIVDGTLTVLPLPSTAGLFANFDRIDIGRDPDTPSDAIYRTTRFENAYQVSPFQVGYNFEGQQAVPPGQVVAQQTDEEDEEEGEETGPAALGELEPAAGPVGLGDLEPAAGPDEATTQAINAFFTDYWTWQAQ